MKFSERRLIIVAVAVIVLVAGGFAWATLRSSSSSGPLVAVQSSADSGPAKGTAPISIGDITFGNSGAKDAVITSITPVSPTPGLNVTFHLLRTDHPSLGEQQGAYHQPGLVPVNGFVVAPSAGNSEPVEVIAALQSSDHQTKRYTVNGLNVRYHVGDHNYTLFIDEGMAVCYTFPYRPHTCAVSIPDASR